MSELCPHGRHEGAVCILCDEERPENPTGVEVKKPVQPDPVSNPMHYTVGGYEAIDIMKAKLTREEFVGAMKFNILKYTMRANYKGHHDQDMMKAAWYAQTLEAFLSETA